MNTQELNIDQDVAREAIKSSLQAETYSKNFAERIDVYRGAHGTVLVYEDQDSLAELKKKFKV